MADSPPNSDTGDDTGVGPRRASPPGMPRWVKISLVIVIVLVLAFLILNFAGFGGGGHGPRRHSGGGNAPGGLTPTAWVSQHE